jgi:hypothetical protein
MQRADLALTMCPGQNNQMWGGSYANHISEDVAFFSEQGVNLIVCLLDDYELVHLGCDPKLYEKSCKENSITLYKYPVADFEPP